MNEGALYVNGEVDSRIGILRDWLDAGLELGNHAFSHVGIDSVSLPQYEEDVIRGETVIRISVSSPRDTLEGALQDPAYSRPEPTTRKGWSWIQRWILDEGGETPWVTDAVEALRGSGR